jgi:hypothetical protein
MAQLRVHVPLELQWLLILGTLFTLDATPSTHLLAALLCLLALRPRLIILPFHKQRPRFSYLEFYARKPKYYLPEVLYRGNIIWLGATPFVYWRYGHACMVQYRRNPAYSAPSFNELAQR